MTAEHEPTNPVSLPWHQRNVFRPIHALWLFLLLGYIQAGLTVRTGAWLLTVPTETSRTEAFILNGSIQIAHGNALYYPVGKAPYWIHVYNPLTYIPAGLAGRVFDLGTEGIRAVGRYLSYISTLLLALVLLLWVRRETRDWKAAAFVAVGLFYFHLITLTDFYRFRPESPGLLFTFWGVSVFCSQRRRRLIESAVLFFAAFLFKQSFIAAPISAFLYLLIRRDFKDALRFCGMMAGQLAVFFLLMFAMTGKAYFESTMLALANNEMMVLHHLGSHHRYITDALYGLLIALPVALVVLAVERRGHFMKLYLPLAVAWAIASAGKMGADYNYYNEAAIALLATVALALGARGRGADIGAALILASLLFQIYATTNDKGLRGEKIDAAVYDLRPYIERYREMPGRKLITEEIVAIHVGDPVGFDWFLLEHLEKRGALDLSPLFERIERGEFDVIGLGRATTTILEQRMRAAIEKGPYAETRFGGVVVEYWKTSETTRTGPTSQTLQITLLAHP